MIYQGTKVSIIFTTLLMGVNSLILGFHPYKRYQKVLKDREEEGKLWSQMRVANTSVLPGLPPDTKFDELP